MEIPVDAGKKGLHVLVVVDLGFLRAGKAQWRHTVGLVSSTKWPLGAAGAIHRLLTGMASADEIILENGDRISGEVVAMENDELLMRTTYAGEIFVTWSQVKKINLDKPVTVVLSDDASVEGVIESAEENQSVIVLDKTRERVDVNLADVKKIDTEQADPSKISLSIRANVGMEIESGNTDKEKYHVDGRAVARKERHRFTLGFEYDNEYNSGNMKIDRH